MKIEAMRELKTLASVRPELNMANYTEDDVRHLNDWAIEMSLLVEQYTLSQQPDNAACKSVQKRLEAQQPATGEPVVVQHRKPVIGWRGETIGYTAWMDGKGLDGWPHRELYDHPAPSVPEGYALVPIEPTQEMLNVQTWDFSRFYSPREIWAAMLAAKEKT